MLEIGEQSQTKDLDMFLGRHWADNNHCHHAYHLEPESMEDLPTELCKMLL